jgi:hypothetical protein
VTDQTDDEAHDREWREIAPETWEEFFRLVRLGIHRTGTCMESLGHTRQAVTMRKKRQPEFAKELARVEAEGRLALTQEMVDVAKKAGQWQALSRRLEIVHGELHPVDEAKVDSLRRAEDPTFLRELGASIAQAFGTLPVQFERPPLDADEPAKTDDGDEATA